MSKKCSAFSRTSNFLNLTNFYVKWDNHLATTWGTVWILANVTPHPLPFHHSPSNRIIPNATLYCSREQTLLLLNSGRGLPWSDNLILQISYDELMHCVEHCGANFLSYNRINFATPLNFFLALSNSVLINLKRMSMEVGFCCTVQKGSVPMVLAMLKENNY